jgi:hypothetical protein
MCRKVHSSNISEGQFNVNLISTSVSEVQKVVRSPVLLSVCHPCRTFLVKKWSGTISLKLNSSKASGRKVLIRHSYAFIPHADLMKLFQKAISFW